MSAFTQAWQKAIDRERDLRAEVTRLSERVEQLQNRLNEDSQQFHILTLKAQVEQAERERDERLTEDESRTLALKVTDAKAEQERLREALPLLLRWIELTVPESLLAGRGNDEYFDVNFRASALWNLRHAAEAVSTALAPPDAAPQEGQDA